MRRILILGVILLSLVAAGKRLPAVTGPLWIQTELAAEVDGDAPAFREWTHAPGAVRSIARWALPGQVQSVRVSGEYLMVSDVGSPFIELQAGAVPETLFPPVAGDWTPFSVTAAVSGRSVVLTIGSSKEFGGVIAVRGLALEAVSVTVTK